MKKAIFLDRDGVINKERGAYTYKLEDFVLNDDVAEAMKRLKKMGYLLIVISNQGGIAKGLYDHTDVENLHHFMKHLLSKQGAEIDEVYYCPHHSDIAKCICRKPNSLLIEKAIARFGIDPGQSFMFGDGERDCMAAEKAGVKGIRIEPNASLIPYLSKTIKGF